MARSGKEKKENEGANETKKGCRDEVGMETEHKRKKGSCFLLSSLTFPLRCFAYWTTNSCASTSLTVFGAYLVPSSAMVASHGTCFLRCYRGRRECDQGVK